MGQTERAAALPDATRRSSGYTNAARFALSEFLANESGATAIEYAMIASLVSILIVTAVTSIGTKLSTFFQSLVAYV